MREVNPLDTTLFLLMIVITVIVHVTCHAYHARLDPGVVEGLANHPICVHVHLYIHTVCTCTCA